jgi:hypothetical protein
VSQLLGRTHRRHDDGGVANEADAARQRGGGEGVLKGGQVGNADESGLARSDQEV